MGEQADSSGGRIGTARVKLMDSSSVPTAPLGTRHHRHHHQRLHKKDLRVEPPVVIVHAGHHRHHSHRLYALELERHHASMELFDREPADAVYSPFASEFARDIVGFPGGFCVLSV
mmetsp:Transcript_8116/g.29479  ORF Transcript_8116/g.29479 Transcript_8116/m.29479 type:complete len:116 (-) Transcript_8116:157-504(-)